MKCFRSKVSETSLENDKSKQQFAKIRDFSTKRIKGGTRIVTWCKDSTMSLKQVWRTINQNNNLQK